MFYGVVRLKKIPLSISFIAFFGCLWIRGTQKRDLKKKNEILRLKQFHAKYSTYVRTRWLFFPILISAALAAGSKVAVSYGPTWHFREQGPRRASGTRWNLKKRLQNFVY
jgi:hypothetical protein